MIEEVAPGVRRIALGPRGAINTYLVGSVLVDAGYALTAKALLGALEGERVRAHMITHAHGDHVGGSRKVCSELGVELWAHARDVEAAERGRPVPPARLGPFGALLARPNGWPKVKVDRTLSEGEEVDGFTVLETPGHSPGHISLWRESDRVLITGDVWFNLSLLTLRPGLHAPPGLFTPDPEENRRSMHRLVDLEPETVCFGHGPVLLNARGALRVL